MMYVDRGRQEVDFRLPEEDKKAWVEALRSGKYGQAQACLRSVSLDGCEYTNNFCCLGVYADVKDPNGWRVGELHPLQKKSSGYLDTSIIPHCIQRDLARMNDAGSSFAEIADWIEENL